MKTLLVLFVILSASSAHALPQCHWLDKPMKPMGCEAKEPACMCFGGDSKCVWVWVCG